MTQSFLPCRLMVSLAAVMYIAICLPTTTSALSLSDVIQGMMTSAAQEQERQEREERSATPPPPTPCLVPTDPHDLQDMQDALTTQLSDSTFLRPATDGSAILVPSGYHDNRPSLPVLEEGESTACPTGPLRVGTGGSAGYQDVRHNSLCPFYTVVRQLPQGYVPSSYREAVCKCPECRGHSAYGCQPVKTNITLLRPAGCVHGMQRYEQIQRHVAVACVCAAAGHVVQAQPL